MPEIIKDTLNWFGTTYQLEYWETDTFDGLPLEKCKQHYGVCFYQGKLVLGWGGKKQQGGLRGGTVEPGETLEETLRRELIEEANLDIIFHQPLGVQKVISPDSSFDFQLRSVCIVEPRGKFISDPDGSIKKIAFVNPEKYKDYFDWGEIGERMMKRALVLLPTLKL